MDPEKLPPIEKLKWVIDRITYKPGWKIEIVKSSANVGIRAGYEITGYAMVRVAMPVHHLSIPNSMDTIYFSQSYAFYQLDRMSIGDIVKAIVEYLFTKCELHEMNEWLKFDGFHITEPHPEMKNVERPKMGILNV